MKATIPFDGEEESTDNGCLAQEWVLSQGFQIRDTERAKQMDGPGLPH